jgi:hypothetical protein
LALITYLVPKEHKDAMFEAAALLTKEQKIKEGKELFRKRYEKNK